MTTNGDGAASSPSLKSAFVVSPQPQRFIVSACPGPDKPLPAEIANALCALQKALKMPLWMIVQSGDDESELPLLDDDTWQAFFDERSSLPTKGPIALLVHSPGGFAQSAYKIATLLRRRCGGFVAVVPRYAKSAATLLCLGAELLVMDGDAELGPLDAQIFDFEREQYSSALDEVQALERVNAFALQAIDEFMVLALNRSGKKIGTMMPSAVQFIGGMMRPLMEKIDTVHYSQSSRVLKVAEEYALRLLKPRYPAEAAKIARHLVEKYPEHGFVIDVEEASRIGLHITSLSNELRTAMNAVDAYLDGMNAVGELREVSTWAS